MSAGAGIAAVSFVLLALSLWRFGRAHPGYSHVRHTISELGQRGAPNAAAVSFGVFLPFGLAMVLVCRLSYASSPQAAQLAACIGVGYVGAALFPCDPGSPLVGSWRQSVHNLAGAVQYVGGAAVIAALATRTPLFALLAVVVGLAAVLLSVPAAGPWRGAVQRVAELTLFASLLIARPE